MTPSTTNPIRSLSPTGTPNFANRTLFQGDNLDVMRGINSATIDLIATDPPFNKGRDFHATPDSLSHGASFQDRWRWDVDVQPEWLDQIQDDWPATWFYIDAVRAFDEPMAAYLCFMGVRLMEMERLLTPTGSIYLHCDPTASHYLKGLMDTIFGRKNFRNEIIWYYKNASRGKAQHAKAHENILLYAKDGRGVFNRNAVLAPYESGMTEWRYKKAGKTPPEGKTPDDVIIMPALNTMDKERMGYPTQKPLALYERLILAGSNEGDIVFDPFAGCATTCVAAERLGRQWVGADYWPNTHSLVVKRLNDSKTALRLNDYRQAVHKEVTPPVRTDAADVAAPALKTLYTKPYEPALFTRDEMVRKLGEAFDWQCWGCNFKMISSDLHALGDYFHLHHRIPHSEGGSNELGNRCLLCPPCNNKIGNVEQLTALRRRAGYGRNKRTHPVDLARATRWAQAEENKRREERIAGRTPPMRAEKN